MTGMSHSQPMGDSLLSVEDQMMLDAVLIGHLKARITELEGTLEQARSFARQVQYMDGVRKDHSCASVAAHYAQKFDAALSHAGPVARDGER